MILNSCIVAYESISIILFIFWLFSVFNVGGIALIKNRQEIRKLTTCMHADRTVVFSQTWCNSISVISTCSGHYDVKSWLNFFNGIKI